MRWDVFCRVVDNFGDIGVCWRLSRQLVNEHGRWVRLWVDDWLALRHVVPQVPEARAPCLVDGVEIFPWETADASAESASCVIEAFACALPPAYVATMRERQDPPVWINFEYLSAEHWIEDCHGLPSPDPATGLSKTFFFPGFTPRSGGLIREADVFARRDAAQGIEGRALWLARHATPGASSASRWISLFCYDNAALPALLARWQQGETPVLLWVPEGVALRQVIAALGVGDVQSARVGQLTVRALPFLSQRDYDALLALCDVNFVRGEDSFVRAQWAARPFVWQAYAQADDTHLVKVNAFLARYSDALDASDARVVAQLWLHWNQGGDAASAWPAFENRFSALSRHARDWCARLAQQEDLAERLVKFVDGIVK